jgi:hypothetical protein
MVEQGQLEAPPAAEVAVQLGSKWWLAELEGLSSTLKFHQLAQAASAELHSPGPDVQ